MKLTPWCQLTLLRTVVKVLHDYDLFARTRGHRPHLLYIVLKHVVVEYDGMTDY